MDRRTPAGNPNRVPPVLAAIDQPQEGLPRVIHPVGLRVGRPDPTASETGVITTMSDQYADDVKIERDGTYTDEQGNPFRFKAGDRISAAQASAFPELAGQIEKPIRGAVDARALSGAPENKALGSAPENRAGGYEAMTVPELRELAAARGVQLPSDARKADVISALSGAGGGLARGNEGTATAPDGDSTGAAGNDGESE